MSRGVLSVVIFAGFSSAAFADVHIPCMVVQLMASCSPTKFTQGLKLKPDFLGDFEDNVEARGFDKDVRIVLM